MRQSVNLTNTQYVSYIDNGIVKFNLSAWLGGFDDQDDDARVSVIFLDQINQMMGNQTTIGAVLAVDRRYQTSLLFRQATGLVPVGARSFTVLVEMTRLEGQWNDGAVDNIAMYFYQ